MILTFLKALVSFLVLHAKIWVRRLFPPLEMRFIMIGWYNSGKSVILSKFLPANGRSSRSIPKEPLAWWQKFSDTNMCAFVLGQSVAMISYTDIIVLLFSGAETLMRSFLLLTVATASALMILLITLVRKISYMNGWQNQN